MLILALNVLLHQSETRANKEEVREDMIEYLQHIGEFIYSFKKCKFSYLDQGCASFVAGGLISDFLKIPRAS